MFEMDKLAQVATEMSSYHLCVLGIAETRWTECGQRRFLTAEMLRYSGHEADDAAHTSGVALMLSKPAHKALTGWEEHEPRIISATFQTKHRILKPSVVQCYALPRRVM